MKHINLKSIFATFLLLVGVCQASWGDTFTIYVRNVDSNGNEYEGTPYIYFWGVSGESCTSWDNDSKPMKLYTETTENNWYYYELTDENNDFGYKIRFDNKGKDNGNDLHVTNNNSTKYYISALSQNITDNQGISTSAPSSFSSSGGEMGELDQSPTPAPECSKQDTVSEGSDWRDITNSPCIYFNNAYAQYSKVAILLGRQWNHNNDGVGSEGLNLSKISNTNLYFLQQGSWNKYTTFLFIQENNWGWEGKMVTNRLQYTSNHTNTYNISINGGCHLFTARCSEKGANLDYATNNRDNLLHKKQTVQIMLSTDGGTSYATTTELPGTIKAKRYLMSGNNTVSQSEQTLSANSCFAEGVLTSVIIFTASATQQGYEFVGWSINNSSPAKQTDTYSYTIGDDATIYAYYKQTSDISSYTVTFENNGHGTMPDPQTVEKDATAHNPGDLSESGWIFGGWYMNSACTGEKYNFDTPVTASITLYAKWTKDYSSTTYYFMGEITGWDDGKGRPMTSDKEYAYIDITDNQAGKNFKIYNANLNNDEAQYLVGCDTTLFDTDCQMDETYKGNIILGSDNSTHHNIKMPDNAPSTCRIYLYYPNTSINPSNSYVVTAQSVLQILPQDKDYYFMSEKNMWGSSGILLTIDETTQAYAYLQLTSSDANTRFKIFENNNDQSEPYYGDPNINNDFNGADITLSNDWETWHNAFIGAVESDWYVILYFPNTIINSSNNYYLCASTTLPGASSARYRLVYAEKKADGNYEKFHPSTPYIRGAAEGEAKTDIVSLHVRYNIPGELGKDDENRYYNHIIKENVQKNPNTLLVYLQKTTDGQNWTTVNGEGLDLADKITENGVYNFVIEQDEEGNATIADDITPYTGKYYIRTDVAGPNKQGGWNNYTDANHVISYSDYAADHRHFDHYWCEFIGDEGSHNLQFTIANDYSNCVSDTCLTELVPRDFTDDYGTMKQNWQANVRFMWNSLYNITDRAYIAGADDCLFFEIKDGSITLTDNNNKFKDRENWTYAIDVTSQPNAEFAVTKKPHSGAGETRYYVVGSADKGETLVQGTGRDDYKMRVVYDFKSDHLIYAWIPDENTTIEGDIELGATIVCMRTDHGDATQVTFDPSSRALNKVASALGVLSLKRETIEDGQLPYESQYYWISFPFDVEVSDIFSSFVWDRDYIIQEYDGASRAANGCWVDSPSYWRTLSKSDKLKRGQGYVLYISQKAVKDNSGSLYHPGNKTVEELNIYFPSAGDTIMKISGELPDSVKIEEHICTIDRNDRYIYDTNWNLIGVPSWENITGFTDGTIVGTPEETDHVSYITNEDKKVGFYYRFNTGSEGQDPNTWTIQNVELDLKGEFKNMHAYLVQWAGIINWKSKSWINPEPSTQGLQARRAAEAKDEQYTLRLELSRGEAALDQTFVRLQEDGDVTADYDMNYDMTKIVNPGANLYSLIGEKRIQAGANVLPLPAENTTVYVPVGVVADKDGMYRFSMPDGTEGMLVSIADHETGMTYNLATGDYEVPLTADTYEQRFVLEIQPKKNVTTGCNESTVDESTLRKVLIDGNLYIQRGDALYDAAGRVL